MSLTNCAIELTEMEEKRANLNIPDEGTIREYYDLRKQLRKFGDDVQAVMSHPEHCLSYMTPGRLVQIKHKDMEFGWGIVVNWKHRKPPKNATEEYNDHQKHVVDVLLNIADGDSVGTKSFEDLPAGVRPPKEDEKSRMEVVPVVLSCIQSIAHVCLRLPKDLKPNDTRNNLKNTLEEVKKRFPDGIATLDPIENMGIKDDEFKKTLRVSIQYFTKEVTLLANRRCRKSRFWSPVFSPIPCTSRHVYPNYTISTPRRWIWETRSRRPRRRSRRLWQSCNSKN